MTGAMELQPDDGPRSNLSIGPGFKQCSGISLKFARRFTEGIGKLAGNTPGDRLKKTGRLVVRMLKVPGLVGAGKSLVNDGCTTAAQAFRQLTMADPLRLGG
ncbi:hypothetical protein GW17_00010664 [Ensete ventricosum]|nr:hypothetical protein GW17_00010664 [Ensete ventricosum]